MLFTLLSSCPEIVVAKVSFSKRYYGWGMHCGFQTLVLSSIRVLTKKFYARITLLKHVIFCISVSEHCRKPKIFLVLTLIMESWRHWMKMVMKRKRKKKMNMWMKKEKMLKEGAGSSEWLHLFWCAHWNDCSNCIHLWIN